MRRMCWQQLRFSPTMMGKWRITVLGKPVLSPPIKGTFRIPIDWYLKRCIKEKGKREKLVFCFKEGWSWGFTVLKTEADRVCWSEDLKQSDICKNKMESGNKFIHVQILLYMMLVKNLKVLGPVIK